MGKVPTHTDDADAPVNDHHAAPGEGEPFSLGNLRVYPKLRRIIRDDESPGDQPRELYVEPKVMCVFVALVRHAGDPVSRDDLISWCWDGRIISDSSINRVISLARSALADLGETGVVIETIPKVGYRLCVEDAADAPAPLIRGSSADRPGEHITPAVADDPNPRPFTGGTGESPPPGRPAWTGVALVGFSVAALLVALIWWTQHQAARDPVVSEDLAIIASRGHDTVDPFLASGLQAELRNELIQTGALTVAPGLTVEALSKEGFSPAQIGNRIGVDHVLSLEIFKDGERISVDANLIDVADEVVVWSQSVASGMQSANTLTQRLARQILAALDRPLVHDIGVRKISDGDLILYLTARGLLHTRDQDNIASARRIMEGVVERNPDFASGLSVLAKAILLAADTSAEDAFRGFERKKELVARALALDPNSVEALKMRTYVVPDASERVETLRQALEIDPFDAEAWMWLANAQLDVPPRGDELVSAQRVIALAPLWNRAWQSTDTAESYGRLDLADEMDRLVITAAFAQWQRDWALARMAKRRGDLSEFFTLAESVYPHVFGSDRRMLDVHIRVNRHLAGLPTDPEKITSSRFEVKILEGDVPAEEELRAAGAKPEQFWKLGISLAVMPGLLLMEDRGDELIAGYDAAFDGPDDFAFEIGKRLNGSWWVGWLGAYLGFALEQAGRVTESQAVFQHAEAALVTRLEGDEPVMVEDLMAEATLSAARGDTVTSIAALEAATAMGWPFVGQVNTNPGLIGPLTNDPLFKQGAFQSQASAIVSLINNTLDQELQELCPAASVCQFRHLADNRSAP